MRAYNQVVVREVVNAETGEVKTYETEKVFTSKISPDHFYMVFLGTLPYIFQNLNETSRKVLAWLCENAEYNTGITNVSTAQRRELCEILGITNNAITNALRNLKTHNFIKGRDGKFEINPKIFWKGDTQSRNKLLENGVFEVSYKIKDGQIDEPEDSW